MEEWRAVPDYEGLYEVSNKGNVRNVRRNTLLRLTKTKYGYIQVWLYKNGIRTGLRVHRLVAKAFLLNPENLTEVNHKDEDKANNRINNLEWCATKYNCNYGTRNERRAENCKKKIYSLDKDGTITYYNSRNEAGAILGIDPAAISKALSDKYPHNKTAAGKQWIYI